MLLKLMGYPKLVDTPNSMSSLSVIEKTLRYLLDAQDNWSGIWNVYDLGVATPFEIGEMLAREGLRERPVRISKEDLDQFHTPKRVDTVLYDSRFEKMVGPSNVRVELEKAIADLKVTLRQSERSLVSS